MTTDDRVGMIKSYVGEGEITDDSATNFQGGAAVLQIPNLQTMLNYICKNGFEHHVSVTRGHYAKVLTEAIETYLGWDFYQHY